MDNVAEIVSTLSDLGLQCMSLIPDHFSEAQWGNGAFTSRSEDIRRKAINITLNP